MARKRLLTAEEAVLLRLLDFVKCSGEAEVPPDITQAGISRAIGVRRSHVSQSLDAAVGRGAAEEILSRVKGEKRKRKCYFLTHTGIPAAREIQARVGSAEVRCILPDGSDFKGTLSELAHLLGPGFPLPRLALLVSEGGLALPAPPRDGGAANSLPPTGNFVGRKAELGMLAQLFGGRTRLLLLTGMPGMGKTWLAARAAAEFGRESTFWYSVTEWSTPRHASAHLADHLQSRGHDRLRRYLDAREVPDLADLQDIIANVPFSFTMIFDDCQNAGVSTARFLRMLASVCVSSENASLGLLGRKLPDLGARLDRTAVIELSLEPLDPASSAELLRNRGLPEDEIGGITGKSGGHPLYLSLARVSDGTTDADDIGQAIAREIWSGLPDAANRILYQLSVFRAPVGTDALAESMEDIETLEDLKGRGIVTDAGGWAMHGLLKEFYCSRQPPSERRARHERAAEHYNLLESSPDAQAEEIYHLLTANDFETATLALVSRGNSLLGRGYVDEILDLIGMMPESRCDDLFGLNYLKGSALDLLGDWTGASEAYGRCLDMAPDTDREADVLRRLGAIKYRRGDLVGAAQTFGKALAIASEPALIAELQGSLGVVLWKTGDTEGAREAHSADLAISENGNDIRGTARALNNLGILDWQSGDAASALEKYARALGLAERIPDNRLIAILYSNMGDAHRASGNAAEAKRYYGRCLELAEDLKFNWQVAEAHRGLALAEPEKARAHLAKALRIFERLGAEHDAEAVREMMR